METLEPQMEELFLKRQKIYLLPVFISMHHNNSYKLDHAILPDSWNHFVTPTPSSTLLYRQHRGYGTCCPITSLNRTQLMHLNQLL